MNKTQRTLHMIAVILGIALCLLLIFSGYQWAVFAMDASALRAQRVQLTNVQKQAADLLAEQAAAKQVAPLVKQQPAGWGWSEQLPLSITQLSALEKSSGVMVDTLQPSNVVASKQLTRYPIHLTLHSELAGLTKFLQGVQQATPLCAVDQLAIHAGKTPGEHLTVDLTLSSYAILDTAPTTGGKP
jgi:Tfp pilus assembly protein PilO